MKKIILSMFLLGTLVNANAQVPNYVPSNGLVGWWPFSGNANDLSGNGNHGTVKGAVLTNDRNGSSNSAYSFNGTSDYIETLFGQPSLTSLTMAGWIKTSIGGYIISNGFLTGGYELFMHNQSSGEIHNGKICFYQSISGGGFGKMTTNTFLDNNWHHVVGVVQGYTTNDLSPDSVKIYVDGILVLQDKVITKSGFLPSIPNSPFYFGKTGLQNSFCNGKLDDVGIWSRALDSNEIKRLYQGCTKSITQQPKDISTSSRTVVFNCNANDTLQTFQWQILKNSIWTNLKDSAQFAGTKSNQLTVNQLLASNNGQKFKCNVSGKCINASSNIATLNYNCKGDIVKQPSNQGMFAGNATFFCATNDTLVNYQWQTNSGTGWNNLFNAGQYIGSNSNSLLVSNVTLSNNNQLFRCIIKGDCLTDTTSDVSLRVWGMGVKSEQTQAFKVYPNPTKDVITIDVGDISKMIGYSIAIYNSLGQQQLQSSLSQKQLTLDLNQFGGNGIYFIELSDNNGNIVDVKKIVLQ